MNISQHSENIFQMATFLALSTGLSYGSNIGDPKIIAFATMTYKILSILPLFLAEDAFLKYRETCETLKNKAFDSNLLFEKRLTYFAGYSLLKIFTHSLCSGAATFLLLHGGYKGFHKEAFFSIFAVIGITELIFKIIIPNQKRVFLSSSARPQ